ncbi:MAG: DUF4976 domain-containing protein, partial [Kiritimatiellaeota bacterium]|nr:DUF4976 domain-containing protein [Kiritimatiellota bacterium]
FPKGGIINDPVELIDVMPTLLSVAGLDIPDNVHGKDLAPQIIGTLKVPHRPTFSEIDHSRSVLPALRKFGSHRVMCRSDRWKLSYSLEDAGYGEDGSLYDLKSDPFELVNLFEAPDCQDIIKSLKNEIEQWQEIS